MEVLAGSRDDTKCRWLWAPHGVCEDREVIPWWEGLVIWLPLGILNGCLSPIPTPGCHLGNPKSVAFFLPCWLGRPASGPCSSDSRLSGNRMVKPGPSWAGLGAGQLM